MPCQKVRTPPLLLPKGSQVLQSVNPGRQNRRRPRPLILLKKLTSRDRRVLRGQRPDPSGRQFPAAGVNGVAVLGGEDARIDAEILPRGQAEGEDPGGGAEVAELVVVEEAELGERLLHLVHGAGAVEELEGGIGLGEDVAGDEGE